MKTLLLTITAIMAISNVASAGCKASAYAGRVTCKENGEAPKCESPKACYWKGGQLMAVCGCYDRTVESDLSSEDIPENGAVFQD